MQMYDIMYYLESASGLRLHRTGLLPLLLKRESFGRVPQLLSRRFFPEQLR
jgi:hypothetical protein